MNKKLFCLSLAVCALPNLSYAKDYFSSSDGDGFKRFSVSAGWLHVMPQGKVNNFYNQTAIAEGTVATTGSVSTQAVLNAIDTSTAQGRTQKSRLQGFLDFPLTNVLITDDRDGQEFLKPSVTGTTTINGLSQWESQNTGLEAQDVDTVGLVTNYYINDKVSLQLIGGIPPKVKIKGKGVITAPLSGTNSPNGLGLLLGDLPLKQDLFITDLGAQDSVASARAWTPAILAQYQFGQSGKNKFRPYVGAGVMYAYFNKLKMNPQTEADLITAGNMIQNIKDGRAGAALDRLTSSANPQVKMKTTESIAPIVSAGFTYDFNDRWFSTASVSYAKLNSLVKIKVIDQNTGSELINARSKIDIDPLISYVGVGYRF